jgi:CheY-like chemotaxis protein
MAEHAILVVEDDATVRELLKYRLAKHYDVATAANGEEALEVIREHAPALIISDIMMPKMDGFALQEALQADKNMRVIPFIFLTARADEPTRREGIRTGVDDYITKPFDMDHLLSRVERLIERAQVYQTNLDAELGRDFSSRLLPKDVPKVPGYTVGFASEAHAQGGGDLFDWQHPSDDLYCFTFGDVMGKGLKAKFYAYSFLSYVRATIHTLLEEAQGPSEVLARLNTVIARDAMLEETFASLLLMWWYPETHRVVVSNAGHCRPIIVRPDGTPELVMQGDLIVGLAEEAEYHEETLTLEPGTALLAYTDGLLERRTPDGGLLGEAGVMDLAACTFAANGVADDRAAAMRLSHLREDALARGITDTFEDDLLLFWLERTQG